jgi:uncharacterized protein (DUF2236 family)
VLSWLRAILLQLAHPLVAAGVAEHSTFRGGASAALSRLHQTVGAMLAITFGDDEACERALEGIRVIHRRVHGSLREPCGGYPAGTPYSAEDPGLLLWVHATLIDSVVRVYGELVAPLAGADRDAYCADAAAAATALGVNARDVPRSWHALQDYLDVQLASGAIQPCAQARQLAAALLAPSRAFVARPAHTLLRLIAAGLLPADVRRGYGLEWSARRERAFRALMTTLRMTRRVAPRRVAWWPAARADRSGPPRRA